MLANAQCALASENSAYASNFIAKAQYVLALGKRIPVFTLHILG